MVSFYKIDQNIWFNLIYTHFTVAQLLMYICSFVTVNVIECLLFPGFGQTLARKFFN